MNIVNSQTQTQTIKDYPVAEVVGNVELRVGVPERVYHSDSSFMSAHRLFDLGTDAFKAVHSVREQTDAMLIGSATHCRILRENDFKNEYDVAPEVNARTKEGKEFLANFASACELKGLSPLKADQMSLVENLAVAVHSNVIACSVLGLGWKDESIRSCHEVVATWVEKLANGKELPCKARFDALTFADNTIIIGDLKTAVSAKPYAFTKSVIDFGYAWQANFYKRAFNGLEDKNVVFAVAVVEKVAPYAQLVCFLDEFADAVNCRVEETLNSLDDIIARANRSHGYELPDEFGMQLPVPSWFKAQ